MDVVEGEIAKSLQESNQLLVLCLVWLYWTGVRISEEAVVERDCTPNSIREGTMEERDALSDVIYWR